MPLDALIVWVQVGVVRVLHQTCDSQTAAIKMGRVKMLEMSVSCVFVCTTGKGWVKAGEREVEEARKGRKMPAYLVLV